MARQSRHMIWMWVARDESVVVPMTIPGTRTRCEIAVGMEIAHGCEVGMAAQRDLAVGCIGTRLTGVMTGYKMARAARLTADSKSGRMSEGVSRSACARSLLHSWMCSSCTSRTYCLASRLARRRSR